jgi:hypothetical protein
MNQIFKLLTLLLAVTLLTGCNKTEELDFTIDITEHFDKEFALQLEKRGYIPDATKITWADVKDITFLDVMNALPQELFLPTIHYQFYGKLTSLAGIEYFSALDTLYCYSNKLTSLDLSKNTSLTYLGCGANQLTSLNVSKNTELTFLDCPSNQLTNLDLSHTNALLWFRCEFNQLTALDVSKCPVLQRLFCSFNQLTTLNISNSILLAGLFCSSNQLTSLDISNNRMLGGLSCNYNPGNGTTFPITAWFDNDNIPSYFPKQVWNLNSDIDIEYIKK